MKRTHAPLGAALCLTLAVLACTLGQALPVPTATALPATTTAPATPTLAPTATLFEPVASPTFPPTATPVPPPVPIFGMELSALDPAFGLELAQAAHAHWARRAAVWWPDVEPSAGNRNWEALSAMEAEFAAASQAGLEPMIVVRGTPDWAQAVPGYPCGPITREHLGTFAAFVGELVQRYSVAPYNVKYWEIWNEPDIDPTLTSPDSLWGCWGNVNDDLYGGGYYAEMLQAVYPQVKAANPEAQVLVGGLLLDCDPRIPEGCARGAHGDKPPKFIQGVLQGGGADYFDGISFHAYDYYYNKLGRYGHPNWLSTSDTTGPVVTAKTGYLKEVLQNYGVTGKYLMNTESALLCASTGEEPQCLTPEAAETKAYYIAESFAASLAAGLQANVWYSLTGWRGSGLTDSDLNPLPAYDAYRFAAAELGTARYSRDILEYPGVSGYEFTRDDLLVWILWSPDATSHAVTLPGAPAALFDVYGQPLTPTANLDVSAAPLFLEWPATN